MLTGQLRKPSSVGKQVVRCSSKGIFRIQFSAIKMLQRKTTENLIYLKVKWPNGGKSYLKVCWKDLSFQHTSSEDGWAEYN